MSSTTSRITELARLISANADKITAHCQEHKLPEPSFDEHASPDIEFEHAETEAARIATIDASEELRDLLVGPAFCLRPCLNATSLHAIYQWNIAAKVPRDGDISYTELAKACGLQEHDVRRIVRFAIIHHRVFRENRHGFVSHSAASRYLVDSKEAMAGLGFMFDEVYQGFGRTVEAFQRNKDPAPGESGWSLARQTDLPMWDYYSQHPDLGQRTSLAMQSFTKGSGHDVTSLVTGYDWTQLNAKKATIVDVGGGNGHASFALARHSPDLDFVVQDLPSGLVREEEVPEDVASRIKVATHDFFTPQDVVADAYLLRQILHDWSDKYCLQILKALVPSLRPGARVICNDFLVPPPGTIPASQEKHIRNMDMIVMTLFNAREREQQDWQALFTAADPRFGTIKAWKPEGSTLAIIEAVWSG